MDAPYFERKIQSYLWRDGKCFFVSTCERETSALVQPPAPRYMETMAWRLDGEDPTAEKRELVGELTGHDAMRQHFLVCTALFKATPIADDEREMES